MTMSLGEMLQGGCHRARHCAIILQHCLGRHHWHMLLGEMMHHKMMMFLAEIVEGESCYKINVTGGDIKEKLHHSSVGSAKAKGYHGYHGKAAILKQFVGAMVMVDRPFICLQHSYGQFQHIKFDTLYCDDLVEPDHRERASQKTSKTKFCKGGIKCRGRC